MTNAITAVTNPLHYAQRRTGGSATLRGHRMTFSHSSKDPLRPLRQAGVPRRGEGVDKLIHSPLILSPFQFSPSHRSSPCRGIEGVFSPPRMSSMKISKELSVVIPIF